MTTNEVWKKYDELIKKYEHGEIKTHILVKKIANLLDLSIEEAICEIVGYDNNEYGRVNSERKRKVYIYEQNNPTTTRPHMRAQPKDKTMKCVIITYQSGKTAVYLKSDPALLDEILHSNDWIVELHEADFVQPQPTATKGGE